jgi:hypothetical protein
VQGFRVNRNSAGKVETKEMEEKKKGKEKEKGRNIKQ